MSGLGPHSAYVTVTTRKGGRSQGGRVLRGEQARMAVKAWNQ